MSTIQTENAGAKAPAKKDAKVKAPKLTPAQQEARDAAALQTAERAGREELGNAQAAFGRQRRLEKAARKDPAVSEILDQNKAQAAIIEQLRAQLVAAQEEGKSAVALLDEAGKVNQELTLKLADSQAQLAAALKPKSE